MKSLVLIPSVLVAVGVSVLTIGYGVHEQTGHLDSSHSRAANQVHAIGANSVAKCRLLQKDAVPACLRSASQNLRQESWDKHREFDDLAAQQKAALWAMIMGMAAIVGTVMSAVGVLLVWSTFKETRLGANAAIEAAKTARQALHGDRAWLMMSKINRVNLGNNVVNRDGVILNITDSLGFQVSWTNFGKTPAARAEVYSHMLVWLDEAAEPMFEEIVRSPAEIAVSPGAIGLTTTPNVLSDEECIDFRQRRCKIKWRVAAFYNDIFTEDQRTTVHEFLISHLGGYVDTENGRMEALDIMPTRSVAT